MSRLSNSKITDMLFSVRQHKRDVQKTTKYVELIIVADNREVGLQTEGLTEIVVQDKLKTFSDITVSYLTCSNKPFCTSTLISDCSRKKNEGKCAVIPNCVWLTTVQYLGYGKVLVLCFTLGQTKSRS